MGSSAKKKREKQKDFQKPKFKVGKTKPKPSSFTDTSFKTKAIVMGHQSLSTTAPDVNQQFKHNLSLASSSKSDKQRRDALAHLTAHLSTENGGNPVDAQSLLSKLLPLISHSSTPVRKQLLKLFRTLPEEQVKQSVDQVIMYIRAGMTHLSLDIRNDALSFLEWVLDTAAEQVVSCPGGWVRTLKTFCAAMGWSTSASSDGWTSGNRDGLGTQDTQTFVRQAIALSRFLQAGFGQQTTSLPKASDYWDALYRIPRAPNAFAYLNLFGEQRDDDGAIYLDCEERQQAFGRRFLEPVRSGVDRAKKEGGAIGRAASALDQALPRE
ncbi:hypothetical protein CDD82_7188 [Ophiocordyceps australis]|uniref:Pre-rRNA-processing protein n=1 Tax=Ophiocordyceps australis TaxID=1399860 RepID=A0A2C5ZQE3_9HYPO|nr:hypothetical protein CDD82_7188 [Ophiocordyceps australis]